MPAPRDLTTLAEPAPGADPSPPAPAATAPEDLFLRAFEDLGLLGRGGMGEVRRVRDVRLDRTLALKIIHPRLCTAAGEARFEAEARIVARLQHPGIVPIHALGRLGDTRVAYAMQEVGGTTLAEVIAEVHRAATGGVWEPGCSGWTLRRLINAVHRACEVVAYAHSRGVIHRDLKPANLMLGAFGEVFVLDWGLAKVLSGGSAQPDPDEAHPGEHGTVLGAVRGTPAYMPPEQARGAHDAVGPWSDVYSLGAVLFEVLTGRPPIGGEDAREVLAGAAQGRLRPIAGPAPLPPELCDLCRRALSFDPAGRPPDAQALAAALADWLDGAHRRDQALDLVAQADALLPQISALRGRSLELQRQANGLLETLRPHSPVADKLPAWQLGDEAARLRREAELQEVAYTQRLHAALNVFPELPEAHARLADHYVEAQRAAEARRDEGAAARAEALLRGHDRGRHAAWLQGDGAVSVSTDPAGAEVALYRTTLHQRRLVPVFEQLLGNTPLVDVPLGRGAWLLELRAPGCVPVRYPVHIDRLRRWDGLAPGDAAPSPVVLPRLGTLGADEVYVPGGWCWVGGDPEAADAPPLRRVWIDGFVIERYAVTLHDYQLYLEALRRGGPDGADEARLPRRAGGPPLGLLVRGPDGGWTLGSTARGLPVRGDWPVSNISFHDATAYARWRAEVDGLPWRLPHELEREKAGRGADGRHYPWGDHLDPTWACLLRSHPGPPGPCPVSAFPDDESPYGVRGLSGGSVDWCRNAYRREGWPEGSRVDPREEAPMDALRSSRGGWWAGSERQARLASRSAGPPDHTFESVGIRLVRSL